MKISAYFVISGRDLKMMFFFNASCATFSLTSLPHTVCPLAARLAAIEKPMLPKPMKPTLEKENICFVTNLISEILEIIIYENN